MLWPFLYSLNIDPRVSFPRGLVNMMASALLASVTEIMDADLAQIGESNINRVLLHLKKDVVNACHAKYSVIIDIHVKVNFVCIGRFTISGAIKRAVSRSTRTALPSGTRPNDSLGSILTD